jgi:hypothetical protein
MRCAVVAVAPPAVTLQREVCAAPGSVPTTARCRSIAASLCACSASPAGARRRASAACASATIQRCARLDAIAHARTFVLAPMALRSTHGARQHRRITAQRCIAQQVALAYWLASALARANYGCFASAVLVARCYRPRVRLRCVRPDRRHSRAQAVRMHAFPCGHPRVHGLSDAN